MTPPPPTPPTPPTPPEVTDLLDAVPDHRRAAMLAVHDVIRSSAPELEPGLYKNIVGYGPYRYRYASGREGDWFVIGLANQKQYLSLYICATQDGKYLAETNAARLGKVSCGRSCIRFKKLEDLDLDVVAELVRTAADQAARGEFAM